MEKPIKIMKNRENSQEELYVKSDFLFDHNEKGEELKKVHTKINGVFMTPKVLQTILGNLYVLKKVPISYSKCDFRCVAVGVFLKWGR